MIRREHLAILPAAMMLLASACGGGGTAQSPTATATPGPSPTFAFEEYNRAIQQDHAKPRFSGRLAGIDLLGEEEWRTAGNSACASRSYEAPYNGPEVFSLHVEDLQQTLFGKATYARACKDGGVTAILYGSDTALFLVTDSPQRWSIDAPAERVSQIQVGTRDAVLVTPTVPGISQDGEVLMATPFGVVVVFRGSTVDEVIKAAAALDIGSLSVPRGKDALAGMYNGIRFYDRLHRVEPPPICEFGEYGIVSRTQPTTAPQGSPLYLTFGYLPPSHVVQSEIVFECGEGVLASTTDLRPNQANPVSVVITRLIGEAAWESQYSDDWYSMATVAGRPAVVLQPPAWSTIEFATVVFVKEDFGLTVVSANGAPDEVLKIAEGLNR